MFLCYFSIQFYSLLRKCIYCFKWYFHMHVLGVRVTFDISKHSALACCTQLALLGHVSTLETLAWGWSTWHLYFINLVSTAPSENHQSDICKSLLSMCVCVRTRIDLCNTHMWSANEVHKETFSYFPTFLLCLFSIEPLKGNLKVTSSEDAEHLTRKQQLVSSNSPGSRCEAKSSRAGVPRRHTVGGARSSQEILAMQPSDMDKKREAFLEHLKQKYPHHASAIMGHQERLREQVKTTHCGTVCCANVGFRSPEIVH